MPEPSFLDSLIGDERPFVIQGENTFTFDQVYRDSLEAERAVRSGGENISRRFVIEADNNYKTYVKLLAALRGKWPVLLCPAYQFHDVAYRDCLRRETGTDFFYCGQNESLAEARGGGPAVHALLAENAQEALFLVRTSGSSGKQFKFIAHRARSFLSFHGENLPHFQRTLAFSPADSIAGMETLIEVLVHRATLVVTEKLSPATVAAKLREHSVDYFQTTPTFLNLMLLARQASREQIPSVTKIAFGSEPPLRESLLALVERLPGVELRQTYGMSEIGILQTHAAPDPSLVAFDQDRNSVRLDSAGDLEVRSEKQMLGYLNYPNSIIADGWFATGDRALLDENGFFRVLGRRDDTINIAGRKFFPTELENLLKRLDNVADVTVRREKNEFLGEAITAELRLQQPEDEEQFRSRLKIFLDAHVPFFMHPHRLAITNEAEASERFKKVRTAKSP